MKKLTSVILIGAGAILFTACSPKVAETTTTTSNTSSSTSSTQSNGVFSGEGRHERNPNIPKADIFFKRTEQTPFIKVNK
jgi:uncharacterized lipoprotein YajG